jgi:hypothetical protein
MNVEIVHDEMDGSCQRIPPHDDVDHLGKLRAGAVRGRKGEVAAGFRFDCAEDIGRSTAPILAVPLRDCAGRG